MKEEKSIILVDNDDLVHMNWRIEMKRQGINLASFYSIDEFLQTSASYPVDTPIFLDSDLGDGTRGEIDGIKIHNKGFKNIKITTGYSGIEKPNWIKSVIGKSPQQVGLLV